MERAYGGDGSQNAGVRREKPDGQGVWVRQLADVFKNEKTIPVLLPITD
jgi:hypothetical protein